MKRAAGNSIILEESDLKNTREKDHEAWICLPPIGTKLGDTGPFYSTSQQKPFAVTRPDGTMYSVSARELNGAEFPNGERVNNESLKFYAARQKGTKATVVPWTKVTMKGSESVRVARITNATGVKTITDLNGIVVGMEQVGSEIFAVIGDGWSTTLLPKNFAMMYDLHCYPNMFDTSSMEIVEPKPLFEIETAEDRREEAKSLADAIKNYADKIKVERPMATVVASSAAKKFEYIIVKDVDGSIVRFYFDKDLLLAGKEECITRYTRSRGMSGKTMEEKFDTAASYKVALIETR